MIKEYGNIVFFVFGMNSGIFFVGFNGTSMDFMVS